MAGGGGGASCPSLSQWHRNKNIPDASWFLGTSQVNVRYTWANQKSWLLSLIVDGITNKVQFTCFYPYRHLTTPHLMWTDTWWPQSCLAAIVKSIKRNNWECIGVVATGQQPPSVYCLLTQLVELPIAAKLDQELSVCLCLPHSLLLCCLDVHWPLLLRCR